MSAIEARRPVARRFAVEAAQLASHTHCNDVKLLDVIGISPVTDYFVIATGTSPRQMRTIVDELNDLAERHGYSCHTCSGYEGETWIVADFIDVVIHLFSSEARSYYDLDNLWGDAKAVDWQGEPVDTESPAAAAVAGR